MDMHTHVYIYPYTSPHIILLCIISCLDYVCYDMCVYVRIVCIIRVLHAHHYEHINDCHNMPLHKPIYTPISAHIRRF